MSQRIPCWYIAVGSVLVIAVGCAKPTAKGPATEMSQADMNQYLLSCPKGRPISEIETDLGLPDPAETEAPASDWPHFKFKYFAGDLVVFFHADEERDNMEKSFVYVGESEVWTVKQYWRLRARVLDRR